MLTQHDKEVTVPQHSLQPRKTKAVALDCRGNSFTSRDIVKVVQGPHKVSVCVSKLYTLELELSKGLIFLEFQIKFVVLKGLHRYCPEQKNCFLDIA